MSSSRPSAFDVLMSNASKKKQMSSKTQQQSSPRKRKNPVESSQNPHINPNNNSQNPISDPAENDAKQDELSTKDSHSDQIETAHVESLSKNGGKTTLDSTADENSSISQSGKKDKIIAKESGPKKSFDSDKGLKVAKKAKVLISPDESVAELRKKAASFDVKRAAYWGQGERIPFMFVVKAFDAISKESGRIAITEIVCNMLRTVIETTPDDLVAVVYLLANRIASAHEGLELGIGDASIIKGLAEACGTKEAHIKKQYKVLT